MLFQLFLHIAFISYSSACFNNDKEIKGFCYTFVTQQMTFDDARNWCHYQNPVASSFLTYVPDQYSSSFLASYARTSFQTNEGSIWIGLSRNNSSSPFRWDNGSPVTYTNFGTQLGQNYVAEDIVNTKWNTFDASDRKFFVCSYDPAASPTFSPPIVSTTQQVLTTDESSCKPSDKLTLLFAYSNDLDPQVVKNSWDEHIFKGVSIYSGFAVARFDLRNEQDIEYFADYENATSYLHSHLPDASLGLHDIIGSDSVKTIEKFYNSWKFPVCGSICIILEKRNPDNSDISKTVTLVRQHHGIVNAISSIWPSGGTEPKALYKLTSETNGISNFGGDEQIADLMRYAPIYSPPFPIYCANPLVSGQNSIELPSMNVSSSGSYWVSLTVQDYGPADVFQSVDLTMSNGKSGDIYWPVSWNDFYDGVVIGRWLNFGNVLYRTKLKYNYTSSIVESLQIRVYSKTVRGTTVDNFKSITVTKKQIIINYRASEDWFLYCD